MLSLDVNVQEIAERYLNEAIAANTVENRGCAIVMNVKTCLLYTSSQRTATTFFCPRRNAPVRSTVKAV